MVAVATGDVADAGFPRPGYGLGRAPAADYGAEPVVAVDHGNGRGRPVVADVRIGFVGSAMDALDVGNQPTRPVRSEEWKSFVSGKSVSVLLDICGCRMSVKKILTILSITYF